MYRKFKQMMEGFCLIVETNTNTKNRDRRERHEENNVRPRSINF